MLPGFVQLKKSADEACYGTPVIAAGGDDLTVLQALSYASERKWVQPILTGNVARMKELADSHQINLDQFELIDSETPAIEAVKLVHERKNSLLMKGQIPTPELLKAVLNSEEGIRTGRVICQMVLMEIKRDERVFLMTDTGITIEPTLSQKSDMLMHAIETAELLGVDTPKLAIMSATEKVNAALPDTLDAEKLVVQARSGVFGECVVSGPLSFDLAYAQDAGKKKNIADPVIGAADAMIFPDLLSANLTVKGIMYTADCEFGGVLCGTKVPVIFMSRADSTQTRINSLAYGLALHQAELKSK
jgi:phosphotransacetylase